jgi:transposase
MRVAQPIELNEEDRRKLEQQARGRSIAARVVLRSRIILLAAAGLQNRQIAEKLKVAPRMATLWRDRFSKLGIEGLLKDAPRPGHPPSITAELTASLIEKTTQSTPANATHWSTRSMAKEIGISKASVSRIWRAHGLKPHRVTSFKVSNDPQFAEKLEDVVGLYLNPPEHAIVLSLDEKSQIQALDRTQPGLPMKKGRGATMTHDYKRNGTTTLFAALEVAQGQVIGQCYARHRHQEFLRFLQRLDEEFPGEIRLHVVMDNYGTHKHPKVQCWLKRHPRFVAHFVPTSSSWLNLVERWFGELTGKRLRRGVFVSVEDLQKAIEEFLAAWNDAPKPFVWTATVESIVEKLSRCKQTLERIKPGCTRPRMRKNKEK